MKTTHRFLITLFFTLALLLPNAPAQDYNTWGLPDGATLRLGKGRRAGNIAFSPDSTRLAVSSAIGIWIYDVRPGKKKKTGFDHMPRSINPIYRIFSRRHHCRQSRRVMTKQCGCGTRKQERTLPHLQDIRQALRL